jgi:uncharacterized membrane protein YphA (DoxX/SURF4 family)
MSTNQIARRRNIGLWIAQILLAGLFLFAGGFKLVAPAAQLAQQSPIFAPVFLKFIGACETLGALGLVLPGWFGVQRQLTPLAASGLVIIMIGAVVSTIATMPASMAILPAVVGIIAFAIARGRWGALRTPTPHAAAPRQPAFSSR